MIDARTEILDRIRGSLGDRTQDGHELAIPEPAYRTQSELSADSLLALFVERLADYGAALHRATPETVSDVAAATLGAGRVVIPDDLDPEWLSGEVEAVADSDLDFNQLDRVETAFTGSTLGIAETGTIVLGIGPGQGRRAISLIPDRHVCVVRRESIFGTVPEALRYLARHEDAGHKPLTFISGPSATSDIELSRVEGVHGPRTFEVILLSA